MSPEEIREYAELLRSGTELQRNEAEIRLQRLSRTDMYRFLDLSNNGRARRYTDSEVSVACSVIFALMGIGLIYSAFNNSQLEAALAGVVGVLLICAAVVIISNPREPDYYLESAVLERLKDPQTVPPLLSALQCARRPVRESIIQALERLLPKVRASDSAMFYPSQRRTLERIISVESGGYSSEFVETVLDALIEIGDETSLPVVRQVARLQFRCDGRIHGAARRCESALELKLLEKTQAETLLRPSDEAKQGTLLHPALNTNQPSDDTLLRPECGRESIQT